MIEDVYITVSQEPKLGLTLDRDVIPDHIEGRRSPVRSTGRTDVTGRVTRDAGSILSN